MILSIKGKKDLRTGKIYVQVSQIAEENLNHQSIFQLNLFKNENLRALQFHYGNTNVDIINKHTKQFNVNGNNILKPQGKRL